jgi:hypothetical protein
MRVALALVGLVVGCTVLALALHVVVGPPLSTVLSIPLGFAWGCFMGSVAFA